MTHILYQIHIAGWKSYNFTWPTDAPNYTKEYIPSERSATINFTVTGLYPATRYRFSVSAESECGRGNESEEATGDTDFAGNLKTHFSGS